MPFSPIFYVFLLLHFSILAYGFGSMGPISAAYGGDESFFCAIDAGGQQSAVCWGKNGTASNFTGVPPVAALSGGEGFMCGILANTSQAYCWDSSGSGTNLVPSDSRVNSYFHIGAGKSHVCAIRGTYYGSDGNSINSGSVDCWNVVRGLNSGGRVLTSEVSSMFDDQNLRDLEFKNVVSGDGFSCGGLVGGGIYCWGPNSSVLGISKTSGNFVSLASGRASLCGILADSGEIRCWGDDKESYKKDVQNGVRLISIAAGDEYFCGIRADTHGIECWGRRLVVSSTVIPKTSSFFAIASAEYATCGIREEDLVLSCWVSSSNNSNSSLNPTFSPPLQLCSPGLCSPGPCGAGELAFNASSLGEPDLTSVCARKELIICSPCASNCFEGFFLSSPCTGNADRVCTPCSLCQTSSCWGVCGMEATEMRKRHRRQILKLIIILGPSIAGFVLIMIGWCLFPYLFFFKNSKQGGRSCTSSFCCCSCFCFGKQDLGSDLNDSKLDPDPSMSVAPCPGEAQIFRLSELKDATNGFKEFNELGRGSYGFVYKAVLADGRQVAVKRANAATIIHTNIRDFETELEILCKLRHSNIINLLGYCNEMGERLLVYEYMAHGTLHDHLHGGLSPLSWAFRLKIAMQASKGLEYLHKEGIVHRDVKTSNILLDFEWGARIADFGCSSNNLIHDKDLSDEFMKGDVYTFGIVLLEILSGRKAYDIDYSPPRIEEWAVPLIRRGKGAAIIDRYVALPRNVEPLLKLADVAEFAVREEEDSSARRPSMSELALSLEQIWKEGLVM